jgi:hypothetical protein
MHARKLHAREPGDPLLARRRWTGRIGKAGRPYADDERAEEVGQGAVEHTSNRPPRLTWAGLLRRTFELDVFACCRCGGRRWVLAYLTARQAVRAIQEHLGLPSQAPRLSPARGPPQSGWC